MKPKAIKLVRGETIIAAVPEIRIWSNAFVRVYIKTNDGRLREECIQSEEQTFEMHALFSVGDAVCKALLNAVPLKLGKT